MHVIYHKTIPQVARLEFGDANHVVRWCIAKGHPTLYPRGVAGAPSCRPQWFLCILGGIGEQLHGALRRDAKIRRHIYVVTKITMSNERQRECGVRIGMRPGAPWRQGDPNTCMSNLQDLACAALRSCDAFDTLWDEFTKNIIHTGLDNDTRARNGVLARFYTIRRSYT
jgi:hypothetical protein